MNLIELERALRQLRLGGMAAVLDPRLRQAQTEAMAPIDLISSLVSDELTRRSERLQLRFLPVNEISGEVDETRVRSWRFNVM